MKEKKVSNPLKGLDKIKYEIFNKIFLEEDIIKSIESEKIIAKQLNKIFKSNKINIDEISTIEDLFNSNCSTYEDMFKQLEELKRKNMKYLLFNDIKIPINTINEIVLDRYDFLENGGYYSYFASNFIEHLYIEIIVVLQNSFKCV